MHARFKGSNPHRSPASKIIDVDATDVTDLRHPDAPEPAAGDHGRDAGSRPRARELRNLERDAREARARALRGVSDDADVSDTSETQPRLRAPAFRERHALKVMGGIMVVMFTLVLVAQVGC